MKFGDIPKYLIELYRALHPEDKTTEEKDIVNVTIKNILTDQPYNDLGFRIGDTVLLLLEAQSTWTVKIIYDGQPGDIINQYVKFTRVANDQLKKYGKTRKAVEETIRICINEDVLAEYLREREVEVMDIMTALFDEEEVSRRYGLRLQREKAEDIAKNMLALGTMSAEDIAKCTGLSVVDIEELSNLQFA